MELEVTRLSVDVGHVRSAVLNSPQMSILAAGQISIKDEGLIAGRAGIGVDSAEIQLVRAVNEVHDLVAICAELAAELEDILACFAKDSVFATPAVERVIA